MTLGVRECGDCQLCCVLVPVKDIAKPANTPCRHQCDKGCAIYRTRPFTCRIWDCRWLQGGETSKLQRPDMTHYVIDAALDFIRLLDNDTGQERKIIAVQVWVDPVYPDAHRDPALREYLLQQGKVGRVAVVRYNSYAGFVLFPPNLTPDNKWHEMEGTPEPEHSVADMFESVSFMHPTY